MIFQFTGTDAMNSVLNQVAVDGQCQRQSFSPYGGSSTALAHTPGFNGERCDPLTGTTHLGNGYRAYNPSLMRFHAPDSMSPFGAGGINPYAYCAGDPINKNDPSGHVSAQAGVGIGLGVLGLALGAASFGVSIAAKVAVVASVAAISTGIASIATENSNPEASAALGWASLGLGIAGAATGASAAANGIQNSGASKHLQMIKTKGMSGDPAQAARAMRGGMSGRGTGNTARKVEYQMDRLQAIGFQSAIPAEKIRYLNVEPSRKYKLTSLGGDEVGSPSGKYLFVNRVDEPQVIRVASKVDISSVRGAGHTSLAMDIDASGETINHDVYVAGEVHFSEGGFIQRWDVSCGHYLPHEDYFRRGPVSWLNDILPPQLFTG